MEVLRTRQDRIRFVHVRHEEAAAFMACGYAKFTGRLGVCLATSGPGGIHLLNGLYDAKLDRQPVLAITGMANHDLIHTYTQQERSKRNKPDHTSHAPARPAVTPDERALRQAAEILNDGGKVVIL